MNRIFLFLVFILLLPKLVIANESDGLIPSNILSPLQVNSIYEKVTREIILEKKEKEKEKEKEKYTPQKSDYIFGIKVGPSVNSRTIFGNSEQNQGLFLNFSISKSKEKNIFIYREFDDMNINNELKTPIKFSYYGIGGSLQVMLFLELFIMLGSANLDYIDNNGDATYVRNTPLLFDFGINLKILDRNPSISFRIANRKFSLKDKLIVETDNKIYELKNLDSINYSLAFNYYF